MHPRKQEFTKGVRSAAVGLASYFYAVRVRLYIRYWCDSFSYSLTLIPFYWDAMASFFSTSLLTSSYALAMTVYTFGIYRHFYRKKRLTAQALTHTRPDQEAYLALLAGYLWEDIMSEMKAAWKTARDLCVLLLGYVFIPKYRSANVF